MLVYIVVMAVNTGLQATGRFTWYKKVPGQLNSAFKTIPGIITNDDG
jgi:hypothetical protein